MTQWILYRRAKHGVMVVYERGSWHRREHLPKYIVSNEQTGRDLEEFRRFKAAERFAIQNKNG